jgi:mono/diheme cytochrome c family protein
MADQIFPHPERSRRTHDGWSEILRLAAAIAAAILAALPAAAETQVERGGYLVNGIANCGNCNSPLHPDGTLAGPALSGGDAIEGPDFVAYPPNITPDPGTGIGDWSEDEIVTALREGRTKRGAMLHPPMPVAFYRTMSDRDAHAIAAYLKSLAPVARRAPDSHYAHPAPASYGPKLGAVPEPDSNDQIAFGHYLAQMGHCMLCHTPFDASGRPDLHRLGAGGRVVRGVNTPNITPDRTSGIGAWSDAQIHDALVNGVRPDGSLLAAPMPFPYLATMRDDEIDAIVAYLRTLAPVGE